MRSLIVFIAILGGCSGYLGGLIDNTVWGTLQARWDFLPSRAFFNQPLTTAKAVSDGFTKISDCDASSAFRGQRYVKNNDRSLILLYDVNGYIAGLQTALPKNLPNGYPSKLLQPPFVEEGDTWVVTAYFTDPAKICSTGRTPSEFAAEAVGTNLYIQNSTKPDESVEIPRSQNDIGSTQFVEGECFKSMGQHYWYRIYDDMSCDSIFPFFLLYNDGQLNGFGFAFTANLTAPIYEHPTYDVLPKFMKSVPKCLANVPVISTLHVYLTGYVALNWC